VRDHYAMADPQARPHHHGRAPNPHQAGGSDGLATVPRALSRDAEERSPRANRLGRLVAWWRDRPTLAAAAVYLGLSLTFVGQGLLPGWTLSGSDMLYSNVPWLEARPADVRGLGANFELTDSALVFQPFLQHTRAELPHVPLWNPHISAGRPYLANAQSAIFSPFSWPAYVLPFWKSLAFIAALKLFVGALGTFLLARRLGMRFGGALLSGLVFAFGTFFVVWLAWPLTNIFPLIPWLLLLAEVIRRRPCPLVGAGLAGLVAMTYFGGHPESTFHALAVTTLFFALRLLFGVRPPQSGLRTLARPALTYALAFAAGTAIAAVMLVPFAELLFNSGDLSRRQGDEPGSWPAKYLGALFLHDYWGRATQQSNIEPFMQVRGWYAGALTLMLASAAVILRPNRERIAIAAFGALTTMVVVGIDPVFWAVTRLPGFSAAHNQRMLIFVLLAVALLAGWGLDDLAARRAPGRQRRAVVLSIGAVILCVPLVWMAVAGTLSSRGLGRALEVAWGLVDPPPIDPLNPGANPVGIDIVHMSSRFQWIPLAGLGLALLALRLRLSGPLPGAVFVTLAVALLVVDLFRANMGFNSAIRTENAVPPETGAIRYLQSRTPNRFVGVSTQIAFQPLPADIAMRFDLYDARGYDYPAEKRYDKLWRRNVAPGVPDFAQPIELASATPASVRALSLLSVSDFLQHPRGKPLRHPGMRLAYRRRDGVVYSNARALPRVFLVSRQRTVKGEDAALAAATAPGFDGKRVAITERRLPDLPQASGGRTPPAGSARLVSHEAERVIAEATARRPSLLVLTDVHFPGWEASVDGRPVPIERVNYLLRGVLVPAGQHRVEFRYEPASFRIGWIISVVGLVAVLAAVIVGLPRRRHA
jgi:Bacterial membrane protein YfhO